MLLDSNPNNDAVEKVALFESMIKGETFTFFDVEDFELIIEYYLELDFKKKAKKALEIALEQYPIDLALTCLLYTSPSPRDRQKSRMPSSA